MSVKIAIKWGKELFKDVEVSLDGGAEVFRQQIFSLTNVDPSNQKVMGKGVTLKDTDWTGFKKALVPGATLMLMGTPSETIAAVKTTANTVFVEDLPEDEQSVMAENLAPGLTNLGNTCYMNASLQMMNAMPEVLPALEGLKVAQATDVESKVAVGMKDIIRQLRNQNGTITPFLFLTLLRASFPRFAQQVQGHYVQQSADECWNQFVLCLKKLPKVSTPEDSFGSNGIEQLLQGQMQITTECKSIPEEKPIVEYEPFESLHCHITLKVNFLFEGINLSLQSSFTKKSPTLGVDAEYATTSRIKKLPYYLVVQLLRFQFRDGHRAKILRPVDFPFELDTWDFCSTELQNDLKPYRDQARKVSDAKSTTTSSSATSTTSSSNAESKPAEDPNTMEIDLKKKPFTNHTGLYELSAVLTHKGRDIDGGHYVAWVRKEGDQWLLFDDDKVSKASKDDIRKLIGSGGAEWHLAYMLLYRPKQ